MKRFRIVSVPVALIGAWLLLGAGPLREANAQEDAGHPDAGATIETAPVRVDGVELFRVRGTSTYPAERRADEIAARIVALARDHKVSPDSIQSAPDELGLGIVVQGRKIFTVAEADARNESLSVREYAAVSVKAIARAIRDYRQDREPGLLLRNGIVAVVATIVLLLALVLLIRLARKLESWFEHRYRRKLESVQDRTFQFIRADRVWWMLRAMTGLARTVLVLILIYVYLQWILGLFPWTRSVGRMLLRLVVDPLQTLVTGFVGYLPELAFLVVLFFVARWILRATAAFFGAIEHGRIAFKDFDAEWATPTYRIVRLVLVAFLVVVAYPYLPGSDTGAFKGVSLFLGLLVSLGSSSIIANVIAGYTMTYRRAFRVGDRIQVNDTVGDVTAIRLFVTTLRTPKNEEVVIPNSIILSGQIVNYSTMARSGELVLHTTVGIGYEVPWRQVEAMLLAAAERTPGLVAERPAFVLQKKLGDFCVEYELNVYCADARRMPTIYTDLHRNIQDAFNEQGVQIMTPAYEGDPAEPKIVPPERWYEAPARKDDRG